MTRVLIVDDDPGVVRTVCRLLSLEGYEVEGAPSGLAALKVLADTDVDLVLSDLNMRPLDGLDLLRRIRLSRPELPFILMSGEVQVEDVAEAMQYGLNSLLLKPVQPAKVREAVAAALALARRTEVAGAFAAAGELPQLWGLARIDLEGALETALDRMEMYFQPIVDVRTGEVVASEALVRPPPGPLQSPLALLEAARKVGRLRASEALLLVRAHDRFVELGGAHQLFLNCSVGQVQLMALRPPDWLTARKVQAVIEVTERERPPAPGPLADGIRSLRRFGVGLAVDDLGAGHAGLLSALALAPDYVKLDRALTALAGRRAEAAAELVALLGSRWGTVIAEGVETIAEAEAWAAAGVYLQQGYLHGRPSARLVHRVPPLSQLERA